MTKINKLLNLLEYNDEDDYSSSMSLLSFLDKFDISFAKDNNNKYYLYADNSKKSIPLSDDFSKELNINLDDLIEVGDDDNYTYLWFLNPKESLKHRDVEFITTFERGSKGSYDEPASSNWHNLNAIIWGDIDLSSLLTTKELDKLEQEEVNHS